MEQVFSQTPEGIGVVDFAGTSVSNKTFVELLGDPTDSETVINIKLLILFIAYDKYEKVQKRYGRAYSSFLHEFV